MKRNTLVVGFVFVILCGLLISFAPDALSMLFVIIQSVFLLIGFIMGIFKVNRLSNAFTLGKNSVIRCKKEIPADNIWYVIDRTSQFFHMDALDKEFDDYKEQVNKKIKTEDAILPDIEEVFNEDSVSLKCYRGVINQISEVLTGLGILGTFVGLIIGIGSIGFSSVAAAVTSLQGMIHGIETAFYTSIAGVILSILFSMAYKFYWNIMLRDMFMFCDEFHKVVIPSSEDQIRDLQSKYYSTMLKATRELDDKEVQAK